MARRDISGQRKTLYYLGLILTGGGVLLFGGVMLGSVLNFGNFSNFTGRAQTIGVAAFIGIACILVGTFLRVVGARGVAGSGLVLDPRKAREDVEPWSRMTGGVVKDAAEEAGLDLDAVGRGPARPEPAFDERLRKLHQLHKDGILTKEEYEREKAEILDEI
ncbi:MAG: SHOCT domain-containing protein [Akkermansiaceae bacterium]|nr:SHOCT domain-containing protein [Akkermansiaceae bacterium]